MKLSFLRATGWAEAASFVLLLGVAMPLKYAAGRPGAVRVMGWIHGLLFVVFCLALLRAHLRGNWPLGRSAMIFVAALLPFGPWVIDRKVKRYEDAAA
jgi:integral membrane protein